MKNKSIVLVGVAPNLTYQFIQRCQALNCKVIIIEKERDINKNTKLIELADEIVSTSIISYETLKEEIKQINSRQKIDGIITFRDYYTEITAKVIEDFKLYGVPSEIVRMCNNKYESRKKFDKENYLITQTKYRLCRNISDVQKFLREINKPIVIKPLKEKGSLGAYKIERNEDIQKYYPITKSFDKKHEGILAEQYIEGKELAFQVFVHNNKAFLYGISEKSMFKNTFIASGYTTINNLKYFSFEEYEKIMQEIIDKTNINFGPILIEGFTTSDKKFYFSEIHTRYAGEHIFEITENSTGYDMLTPIIKDLLKIKENNIKQTKISNNTYVSASRVIYQKKGIIKRIKGLQEAKEIEGVQLIELFCKKGDKINELKSTMDRIGWVIVYAKNKIEIEEILNKVFSKINICMEEQ